MKVLTEEEEHKEFIKIIRRAAKRIKTDKKFAKELFKGSPILNRQGKVKKQYWDLCIELGLFSP